MENDSLATDSAIVAPTQIKDNADENYKTISEKRSK